jgi:hypothetical protein
VTKLGLATDINAGPDKFIRYVYYSSSCAPLTG